MLFSRLVLAAVSLVCVAASPLQGFDPSRAKIGTVIPRDLLSVSISVTTSPWDDATKKMLKLKEQVPDIMTGPKEDREQRFIDLTAAALQIVKDCNQSLTPAKTIFLKLSDTQASDEMNQFSQALTRTVRACKVVRNAQVSQNLEDMMDLMEKMQSTVQGFLPGLVGGLLDVFNIRIGKLDAIRAATSP